MTMRDQLKKNKVYDLQEAREKIRAYCLYRERSHHEVEAKLSEYGIIPDVAQQLISELIEENYLNEERFARAFVRGKFKIKKWGRIRIRQALYPHQLSDYILKQAFTEIDEDLYEQFLHEAMEKKQRSIKDKNPFVRKRKLADYLISRGYEPDMVWDLIRTEMP